MVDGETPPEETGTVFVNRLSDGTFVGVWQGGDDHPGKAIDIEGSRDEVLRWARNCPAAKYFIFDEQLDDYIPLTL